MMDNNMNKQCKTCRHFVKTGICPGGHFEDAGMCIADATNQYTQAGVFACDLYQEKPSASSKREHKTDLDSAILNALRNAAYDHTEEAVVHMIWFCDYLRKEVEENRDV